MTFRRLARSPGRYDASHFRQEGTCRRRRCSISSTPRWRDLATVPRSAMRRDDGSLEAWTYREFERRARIAAWRLRALGLQPGDRILTWSPSCPELAATYFGAMRAGLVTRSAGPAHVARRDRGRRRLGRASAAHPGDGPGCARSPFGRPRPARDDDRRRAHGRSRRGFAGRLGDAARGVGAAETRGCLRAHLHERHDQCPEGRDARPRQRRRLGPQLQLAGPSDGAPPRVAAAALPPARTVGGTLLRDVGRRRHPLRPQPEPAGDLRRAARAPGDVDGARPADSSTCSGAASSGRSTSAA